MIPDRPIVASSSSLIIEFPPSPYPKTNLDARLNWEKQPLLEEKNHFKRKRVELDRLREEHLKYKSLLEKKYEEKVT